MGAYSKAMRRQSDTFDKTAMRLGYAGLLPPAIFVCIALADPAQRWIILAASFGYAAFIFSFLGGVWWGLAMASRTALPWMWFAAVSPSLIALALFVPWTFGWEWPRPAMLVLAALILASPLVDWAMGWHVPLPQGWLRLRVHLSAGLALLTLLLSLL